MTAEQSTLNAIKYVMANYPNNQISAIGWELRRHREVFERIKDNIADTSLSKADADDRMKTLCIEYGYNFDAERIIKNFQK